MCSRQTRTLHKSVGQCKFEQSYASFFLLLLVFMLSYANQTWNQEWNACQDWGWVSFEMLKYC